MMTITPVPRFGNYVTMPLPTGLAQLEASWPVLDVVQRVRPNASPYQMTVQPLVNVRQHQTVPLAIRLQDKRTRQPVDKLQIVHEKPAHLFVVSDDLSDFQHLHPEPKAAGWLMIPARFKQTGHYSVFIQFSTPTHADQTVVQDIWVGDPRSKSKMPLVPDNHVVKAQDELVFRVSNLPTRHKPESMFAIDIRDRFGKPIKDIKPYLGAAGHAVIVSEDSQTFLHTHPMSHGKHGQTSYQSPIQFHTTVDKPGRYKLWVQSMVNGKLRTMDWVFHV